MTYHRLSQIAAAAIVDAMFDGEARYGVAAWVVRSDDEDIRRALAHIHKHNVGDVSEPHIQRAIARLSLVLARPIARAEQTLAAAP